MSKSNNSDLINEIKKSDEVNKMKHLMNFGKNLSENTKPIVRTNLESYKEGADGKIYGIVKENSKYYIKIADKSDNIVAENFNYIGGEKNKLDFVYESYNVASKQLDLKMISLNEAYGVNNNNSLAVSGNETHQIMTEESKAMKDTIDRFNSIMHNSSNINSYIHESYTPNHPGTPEAPGSASVAKEEGEPFTEKPKHVEADVTKSQKDNIKEDVDTFEDDVEGVESLEGDVEMDDTTPEFGDDLDGEEFEDIEMDDVEVDDVEDTDSEKLDDIVSKLDDIIQTLEGGDDVPEEVVENILKELDQSTYYRAGRKSLAKRNKTNDTINYNFHSNRIKDFYKMANPRLESLLKRVNGTIEYYGGELFLTFDKGADTYRISFDTTNGKYNLLGGRDNSVFERDEDFVRATHKIIKLVQDAIIKSLQEPGDEEFQESRKRKSKKRLSENIDMDNYHEFKISKHYLSYLVNGDASGYEDEDLQAIQDFEKELVDLCGGNFILDYDEEGLENGEFAKDDVTGLLSDVVTIKVYPSKTRTQESCNSNSKKSLKEDFEDDIFDMEFEDDEEEFSYDEADSDDYYQTTDSEMKGDDGKIYSFGDIVRVSGDDGMTMDLQIVDFESNRLILMDPEGGDEEYSVTPGVDDITIVKYRNRRTKELNNESRKRNLKRRLRENSFERKYNDAMDKFLSKGGMWVIEMKNAEGDWEYDEVSYDPASGQMCAMGVCIDVDPDFSVDVNLSALYDALIEAGYMNESRKRSLKRRLKENNTVLNDFGKHPSYRKKPVDVEEPEVDSTPFGSKIGDGSPFNKPINKLIVDAVVSEMKKRNIPSSKAQQVTESVIKGLVEIGVLTRKKK